MRMTKPTCFRRGCSWQRGRVDEQTQGVAGSRRRSRSEARQLVVEYEASGVSRVEFCRRRGISLATLARYRKRQGESKTETGNRWIAVEVSSTAPAVVPATGSGLAVALPGGRRIEVERGFDAHTLLELVGVLERR